LKIVCHLVYGKMFFTFTNELKSSVTTAKPTCMLTKQSFLSQ